MIFKFGGPKRTTSGIEGLDTVLNGGFLSGGTYIIHGPPGAGKTIMANQFCFHHAAAGGKAVYVSLLAESHDRMLGFMSRMDFYEADRVPENLTYISAFGTLQEEGLSGLLRLVNSEITRHDATVLVLDGLFVIRDGTRSEQEFRKFVHDLQGQSGMLNCTILLLSNEKHDPASPEHTMVDGWIELMDTLIHTRAARSLVVRKQRGSAFLRGEHFFRITSHGIEVFPRLEALALDQIRDVPEHRMSSGVAALDQMTGGGYPGASASLALGPAGAGKTILGMHFLAGSTVDEPGVLFGFYEGPARLLAKAEAIGIDIATLAASGALEIAWQAPAENLLDELGHRLLALVRRTRAKRVLVDGIGGFQYAYPSRHRLPLFINALNRELRSMGATVLYTAETPELLRLDNLGTDDLSAMTENILLLNYTHAGDALRRQLTILKMRDSDFDHRAAEFTITRGGFHFDERSRPGR